MTHLMHTTGYAGRGFSYDQGVSALDHMIRGHLHWGGCVNTLIQNHWICPYDYTMGVTFNRRGWVYTLAYVGVLRLSTDQPITFRPNRL